MPRPRRSPTSVVYVRIRTDLFKKVQKKAIKRGETVALMLRRILENQLGGPW